MKKALVLLAFIAAGTTAQAQSKEEACQVSAGFVAQAVEARLAGMTSDETQDLIKDSITENKFLWGMVVAPLVKQVYELPEENMTDEFHEKFLEACLGQ